MGESLDEPRTGMEMVMGSNVTHLSQVSEGFAGAVGGGGLFLAVLGVLVVATVVWGVHYRHKRRDLSPFETL